MEMDRWLVVMPDEEVGDGADEFVDDGSDGLDKTAVFLFEVDGAVDRRDNASGLHNGRVVEFAANLRCLVKHVSQAEEKGL